MLLFSSDSEGAQRCMHPPSGPVIQLTEDIMEYQKQGEAGNPKRKGLQDSIASEKTRRHGQFVVDGCFLAIQ